jgi:ABC-type nitrate/sulfonate/bicarbonate transport system permease component
MAGLKIAGGLSLIGAVVAEFTAGTAGSETGLAYAHPRGRATSTKIPMRLRSAAAGLAARAS